MRRLPLLILTLSLLMLVPANAHAFMTWNAPGNAEHERITRMAIACNSALDRAAPAGLDWKRDLCLSSGGDTNKQPWWFSFERSMRMLAGSDGYFGGVGAPDRFAEAVLSSSDRDLNPGKTHDRGWAKCNALISFGRALHITEDFFSHSNWIDRNPSSLDIKNPQGLHNDPRIVPGALGYPRTNEEIDAFIANTQVITGGYGSGLSNRVKHDDYLNTDEGKGTIDWTTGQIPFGDKGH